MNILFISNDLIAGDLAYLLKKEGHNVKLSIQHFQQRKNFTKMLTKAQDWREVKWVGKDGLIIFDDVGYGKIQDKLRQKGYSVFGGSELGDKLEANREFAHNLFEKSGMKTALLKDFKKISSAISFIKKHPSDGPWVVKQNDHDPKHLNYVGSLVNGSDVISVLKNYQENHRDIKTISIQKKCTGVEIGIGRFFNGNDWVGPLEINMEHKKFFPGDIGPTTSEMGTLAWYDDNENNKLFQETLAKLKPYLQKINYKGDIDINCIVNETGAYPLEATARFGSPIVHLQSEIHQSPWGEFLKACADGKPYDLKFKKGFGLVILIAVPPFPYIKCLQGTSSQGTNIYFDTTNDQDLMNHIHFEEVSIKKEDGKDQYYISDSRGYILYVTAVGQTVEEARKLVYERVDKVVIPKAIYRNDIGVSFIEKNAAKLKEWGYLA